MKIFGNREIIYTDRTFIIEINKNIVSGFFVSGFFVSGFFRPLFVWGSFDFFRLLCVRALSTSLCLGFLMSGFFRLLFVWGSFDFFLSGVPSTSFDLFVSGFFRPLCVWGSFDFFRLLCVRVISTSLCPRQPKVPSDPYTGHLNRTMYTDLRSFLATTA